MTLSPVLPPTVVLVLAAVAACLIVIGGAFGIPILSSLGQIAAVAAVVGFFVYLIVLLLDVSGKSVEPDTRLTTYLRAFFSGWLTGMSGPLSVPFAALALWSSSRNPKVIWGCLAALCVVFASYRVWRSERVRASAQLEAVRSAKDQEIESLKAERDALKRRPYDEEHRRLAEQKLNTLSEAGKDLVYFLLHHGKTEAEELRKQCKHDPEFNDAVQRARDAALVVGTQRGEPYRSSVTYFWEVNPHFEAVLQDLLGNRKTVYF
jgi:hypothetical protein